MTDQEKIARLRAALAGLLRQTANPDPIHPAWAEARENATKAFHETAD